MSDEIWNNSNLSSFERHPKITEVVKDVGDKVTVKACDDGNKVDAERIQAKLKENGVKGIKAKDSIVFVVEHKSEKYELWVGATNYTALRQLKEIRENHNGSLKDAMFTIEKVSENDPEKSTFEFSKAE